MSYSSMSFLDTKQEHKRWHKGIYRGLKIWDPRKALRALNASKMKFRDWYKGDYHYHDLTFLASYGLKYSVVGVTASQFFGIFL